MPDVLIRNVSQAEIQALDAQARRLGLSRADFLRRQLKSWAAAEPAPVSTEHLRTLAGLLPDLDDERVMDAAWS